MGQHKAPGKHAKSSVAEEFVSVSPARPMIFVRNEHGLYQTTPAQLDAALRWWALRNYPPISSVRGLLDEKGISSAGVDTISELLIMAADSVVFFT